MNTYTEPQLKVFGDIEAPPVSAELLISSSICNQIYQNGFAAGYAVGSSLTYNMEVNTMSSQDVSEDIRTLRADVRDDYFKLEQKIDASFSSLSGQIRESNEGTSKLIRELLKENNDNITKLTDRIYGDDGISEKLSYIRGKLDFSWKSKGLWIPIACSVLVSIATIAVTLWIHSH